MLYIYESSVTFHFLGFFLSMVSLFFHCVTVKTLFMFIFTPPKIEVCLIHEVVAVGS